MLARTQNGQVVEALRARWPGVEVRIITITSTGDTIQDRPLYEFGGKGLFTKEIEQALLDGEIDIAVHSLKDLPVTMPLVDVSSLAFISPLREDPRDLLVSRKAGRIEDLPQGAKVGTGSLRRRCQVLEVRPDLQIEPIRGNIDTRLRKLREGQYDAVILALAGVKRAGLFDEADMWPIALETMTPAAGQAALALQFRGDDERSRALLRPMEDEATMMCVAVEREVVRQLGGDCHSPIGAYAAMDGDEINLHVAVGGKDGDLPVKRAQGIGARRDWRELVARVISELG